MISRYRAPPSTLQVPLIFGTSELAVTTVLAAYMGGLALGSAVAGRSSTVMLLASGANYYLRTNGLPEASVSGMRDADPLADPRINVVINDARNALRLTRKSYDAIVSQPSHPWTAGASHLFTSEFAANVRLYRPSARVLMFLASDAPLDVELELARTGRPIIGDVMHFSLFGINSVEDLLASLAIDEQGILAFARGAEISTDDNNLMATRSRGRDPGPGLRSRGRLGGAGSHRTGPDSCGRRESPQDAGHECPDARRHQSVGGIVTLPCNLHRRLPDRIGLPGIQVPGRSTHTQPAHGHLVNVAEAVIICPSTELNLL